MGPSDKSSAVDGSKQASARPIAVLVLMLCTSMRICRLCLALHSQMMEARRQRLGCGCVLYSGVESIVGEGIWSCIGSNMDN